MYVCVCVCLSVCLCLRMCLCMCVCPFPRLLITGGVMWHDMNPYDWFKQFYSYYMATIVSIVNGRGLEIDTSHGN